MPNNSEFAQLIDLAISQNISHSSLLDQIHNRILDRYQTMYNQVDQNVEIAVNEKTGSVKLISNKKDVTPDEFKPLAEKIARETIINQLQSQSVPQTRQPQPRQSQTTNQIENQTNKTTKLISQFLFWGYNSLYLLLILGFIFNFITNSEYRVDILETVKKLGYFRLGIISLVASTPILSMVTAIFHQKNKNKEFEPGKILFLAEIPLVIIGLIIFNIFKQPSPAISFFVISLLSAVPIIYLNLTGRQLKDKVTSSVYFFLQQSLLSALFYFGLIYSFLFPLIIGSSLNFFGNNWFYNPMEFLVSFIFGGLGLLIGAILVFLPYLAAFLSFRSYLKVRKNIENKFGNNWLKSLTYISLVIFVGLFAAVSYQPNRDYYLDRLAELKQAETFSQRQIIAQELLPQEDTLKRILDDVKNLRQRYIMAKDDEFLQDGYKEILNFEPEVAALFEATFETVAYPFVYQGSTDKIYQAQRNFQYLFGQEDQTSASRFNRKQVTVDQRKVSVKTDYDQLIATVTVDETYTNSTTREQEVVYEFFIDGDAAIHDLKLGPELEFEGIVAPSGASRKLYNQEVRRTRDPALLEQVGPKQYRLSVFPVPGKNDKITLQGQPQRVQFSYTVAITPQGYPLPQYTFKDNVKDLVDFKLVLDNQEISNDPELTYATNETVKQAADQLCQSENQVKTRTNLGVGTGIVNINNDCSQPEKFDPFAQLRDQKIALIQDVSYRNQNNDLTKKVKKYFEDHQNLITDNEIDFYQFNDLLSQANRLDADNFKDLFNSTYFGNSNLNNTLDNFNQNYDLTFVLTADTDFRISQDKFSLKSPVYLIHPQKILPYNSALTAVLWQKHGNSFTNWEDAIRQAALELRQDSKLAVTSYFSYEIDATSVSYDSELGSLINDNPVVVSDSDPLTYLVAQAFIKSQYADYGGIISANKDVLDEMTALSKQAEIVTPYTSYIALVNQRQLDDLDRFSDDEDRYQDNSGRPAPPIILGQPRMMPFSGGVLEQTAPMDRGGELGSVVAPNTGFAQTAPLLSSQITNLEDKPFLAIFIAANLVLAGIGLIVFGLKKLKKRVKHN